jgi:hypothetical protein
VELAEAKALYRRFVGIVPSYTVVFLSLSEPVSGKSETEAIGSCVHLYTAS